MAYPLVAILLVYLPENLLLTVFGLQIIGVQPRWRQIFVIGLLETAISFLARMIPYLYGIHVIIQMLLYPLVFRLVLGLPYQVGLAASSISGTLYLALESIFMLFVPAWLHISVLDAWRNGLLKAAIWWPQAIVFLVAVVVARRTDYRLVTYVPPRDED